MATLNGPSASYDLNGWFISNNFWDTDARSQGYSLSGTYNPADLTTGLKYTWDFGPLPADGYYWVHAYPEVGFGQDAWSSSILPSEQPFPLAVADLVKYQVNYDLSFGGQTDGYNVAFEMYLTSSAGGGAKSITNEVMVWVHNGGWHPGGSPVGSFSDANYAGKIYSYPVNESGLKFNYTAVLTTTDDPSGTVDLMAIMAKLKALGIIKGTEYITNIQLGAEIAAGKGSLSVNKIQLDVLMAGKAEVVVDGSGKHTVPGASAPNPLAADFDGDRKADIVWANASGQALIWTMNGGTKVKAGTVQGTGTPALRVVTAADFNGDGRPELLVQNSNGPPQIWTMNGLTKVSSATAGTSPGSTWRVIGAGDFNGDKKADILWQDTASGAAKIWLMNGPAVTQAVTLAGPGATWKVISSGDFDGNGKSDILWQNTSTGQAQVWMMDGATILSKNILASSLGASWHAVGTGDFNGDGKSDVLLQNSNGGVDIWLMNGTTIASGAGAGSNPGSAWKAVGTGDYNGDGKADILFQNASGQGMVRTMNGFVPLSQTVLTGPGTTWSAVT